MKTVELLLTTSVILCLETVPQPKGNCIRLRHRGNILVGSSMWISKCQSWNIIDGF